MVVSIILFVITAILVLNGTNKNAYYHECSGTIIRFFENSSEGMVDSYENVAISLVVEYEVNEKRYKLIRNYYYTTMRIGQKFRGLYSENDPSKASIKNGIFFAPIITGTLATVFLIPAIIYFLIKVKGAI